jgi:hypothetical protein
LASVATSLFACGRPADDPAARTHEPDAARPAPTTETANAAAPASAEAAAVPPAATRADRTAWRARLHWPDDCEGAFEATDVSGGSGLEIHALSDGSTLVQIRCAAGAYQPSQLVMRTTDARPSVASILSFTTWGSADGESLEQTESEEVWGELTYLPEAQELTLLSLSRQTGDCGTWAEYRLAEGNPKLEALYVRMPCPATPGEPADPVPGKPPEGWKRIEVR